MPQRRQYRRWVVLILGVIIAASAYFLVGVARKPGGLEAFAQCVREQRALFYGAFWCPHCQEQKALFGAAQRRLPYVECSTPDGRSQVVLCQNHGIREYPTWVFADGSRVTQVLSLHRLAEKTGCSLPQ
jgi:hypothetical protein